MVYPHTGCRTILIPRYHGEANLVAAATWKIDLASRGWFISPYGSEEAQEDRGIILFTPLVSQ